MRNLRTNHLLPLSSKIFTWNKKTGVGSIEESDLRGMSVGLDDLMRQVWPDAADAGFVVRSDRTRQEQVFLYVTTKKSDEGEVEWWEFHSLDNPSRGECGKYKIFIWND